MRRLLSITIFAMSMIFSIHDASGENQSNKLSEAIDEMFVDREDKPGCAVGVIKDGEYIHNSGYGMANLEYGMNIDSDSIFRIASISKQFTATTGIL